RHGGPLRRRGARPVRHRRPHREGRQGHLLRPPRRAAHLPRRRRDQGHPGRHPGGRRGPRRRREAPHRRGVQEGPAPQPPRGRRPPRRRPRHGPLLGHRQRLGGAPLMPTTPTTPAPDFVLAFLKRLPFLLLIAGLCVIAFGTWTALVCFAVGVGVS